MSEMVAICAWCPDSFERTNRLMAEGKTLTHTVCPICEARLIFFDEVLGSILKAKKAGVTDDLLKKELRSFFPGKK